MWICTSKGMVSLVADRKSDKLIARARRRADLLGVFPGAKAQRTDNADYRWRCRVTRDRAARVIATQLQNIQYDNFKNSVRDWDLHDMYLRFWETAVAYQETDPDVTIPSH
jgi:hypothetical protein